MILNLNPLLKFWKVVLRIKNLEIVLLDLSYELMLMFEIRYIKKGFEFIYKSDSMFGMP